MLKCSNCGEHVTPDFLRVFGIDNEVHGCPACATYAELKEGAGARSDGEL